MDCSNDYNTPELFNETLIKKCAKEHKCSGCHDTIEKGESYKRIEGLWDGDFSTFKFCEGCIKVMEELESAGCCYSYDDIREAWEEMYR